MGIQLILQDVLEARRFNLRGTHVPCRASYAPSSTGAQLPLDAARVPGHQHATA